MPRLNPTAERTKVNTAFLVIDLINDIVHEKGKIAACAPSVRDREVLSRTNRALDYARKRNWLVLLCKVGFSRDYLDQPKRSPFFGGLHKHAALQADTYGTSFHSELSVASADIIFTKPRVSPFYGTPLDAALRANRIERLVVCGVSTSWAVMSACRDAHDRDFDVVLLEDACAAVSEEEHSAATSLIRRIALVTTVDDLIAAQEADR
jgi:ureidoacrylate peracid hydrolase